MHGSDLGDLHVLTPPDRHSPGWWVLSEETRAEEAQRRSPGPSQWAGLRMKQRLFFNAQGKVGWSHPQEKEGEDSRQREEQDKAGQNCGRRKH